jgi:RNase P subunit RPR2
MQFVTQTLFLLFLFLYSNFGHAESLYITLMKQAQWDRQALEKALEKLQEHQPIEFAEPLKISPFHHQKIPQQDTDRDFCVTCHTTLPHTQNERLRSYLNMHVNNLACASCHFKPDNVTLDYRRHEWMGDTEDAQSTTILIMPFYQQSAETLSRDHPDIAVLLEDWEKSEDEEKAQLHLKIHTPIKSEGVGCSQCHTDENPMLDYEALGFSADESKLIRENRISRYLSDERMEDKPVKLMDLLQ